MFQHWNKEVTEAMSRQDAHCLEGVNVSFLAACVYAYMCMCVKMHLCGEEGSQLRKMETGVDICESPDEHSVTRALRKHSEACLPGLESQLRVLKPV